MEEEREEGDPPSTTAPEATDIPLKKIAFVLSKQPLRIIDVGGKEIETPTADFVYIFEEQVIPFEEIQQLAQPVTEETPEEVRISGDSPPPFDITESPIFRIVREKVSQEEFGKPFDELTEEQQDFISDAMNDTIDDLESIGLQVTGEEPVKLDELGNPITGMRPQGERVRLQPEVEPGEEITEEPAAIPEDVQQKPPTEVDPLKQIRDFFANDLFQKTFDELLEEEQDKVDEAITEQITQLQGENERLTDAVTELQEEKQTTNAIDLERQRLSEQVVKQPERPIQNINVNVNKDIPSDSLPIDEKVKLPEFDVEFPTTIVLTGKSFSGKSTTLKQLLRMYGGLFDKIWLFSQTAKHNGEYDEFIKLFGMKIFDKIDEDSLENMIESKKLQHLKEQNWWFVFDDVIGMKGLRFRSAPMKFLFTAGRHFKITTTASLQKFRFIPDFARTNMGYFGGFNIPKQEIKKIYEDIGVPDHSTTLRTFVNTYTKTVKKHGKAMWYELNKNQWFVIEIDNYDPKIPPNRLPIRYSEKLFEHSPTNIDELIKKIKFGTKKVNTVDFNPFDRLQNLI